MASYCLSSQRLASYCLPLSARPPAPSDPRNTHPRTARTISAPSSASPSVSVSCITALGIPGAATSSFGLSARPCPPRFSNPSRRRLRPAASALSSASPRARVHRPRPRRQRASRADLPRTRATERRARVSRRPSRSMTTTMTTPSSSVKTRETRAKTMERRIALARTPPSRAYVSSTSVSGPRDARGRRVGCRGFVFLYVIGAMYAYRTCLVGHVVMPVGVVV